jgi:hypothetical protein
MTAKAIGEPRLARIWHRRLSRMVNGRLAMWWWGRQMLLLFLLMRGAAAPRDLL